MADVARIKIIIILMLNGKMKMETESANCGPPGYINPGFGPGPKAKVAIGTSALSLYGHSDVTRLGRSQGREYEPTLKQALQREHKTGN